MVEEGYPVCSLLESWNHTLVLTSRAEALANWPPSASDVLLLPLLPDSLDWAVQARQLHPFPILGVHWPHSDRWAVYAAGLDGCLDQEQEELRALLDHLSLWVGEAYRPDLALEIMGTRSIVEQILGVFVAEAPRLFEELQVSCRSGDFARLARAAHRFSGGVAMLGPIPTQRAAQALEMAAKDGAAVDQPLLVLEQTLSRLLSTLKHRRQP